MSDWESIGKSNEWYTPKYVFDALGTEFDQDIAAPLDLKFISCPAKEFITEHSLEKTWKGFIWANPPFGKRNGITPWLDKVYAHGNGIALAPDRTSCDWWQRAASQAHSMLFVRGKIKFIRPDGTTGDQPSNGTTLFGYGKYASLVLKTAEINNLGFCQIK